MEVIEKTITCYPGDVFHLYPLGDIHLGSIDCVEDAINQKVAEILRVKNSLVLGMGDYADCIRKNDPRFNIEGLAPWLEKGNIIESQRQRVKDLFKPLAKRNKLLGLIEGNHEYEIHLRHQDDITRNLCGDLKVPYCGYSCFVVLNFTWRKSSNSYQVIIHAWHGAGSAQTEGARLMRLVRLVNDIQAHIYLMGHLHAMTQHTPDRLIYQKGRVKSIKLAATITGSWLRTYTQPKANQHLAPSYGEVKGYKPSRIGCPVIHIAPDIQEFTIES